MFGLMAWLVGWHVLWSQGTLLFFEDFDTTGVNGCRVDSILTGWEIRDGGTCVATGKCGPTFTMSDSTWVIGPAPFSPYLSGQVAFGDWSFTCVFFDTLITPYINAGGNWSKVELHVNYRFLYWATNWGKIEVQDSLGNWIMVDSVGGPTDVQGHFVFDITPYAHDSLRVRFIYYDNNDFAWYLDSIQVIGYPSFVNLSVAESRLMGCPGYGSVLAVIQSVGTDTAYMTGNDTLWVIGEASGNGFSLRDTVIIVGDTLAPTDTMHVQLLAGIPHTDSVFWVVYLQFGPDTTHGDDTLYQVFDAVSWPLVQNFGNSSWGDVSVAFPGWEERRGPCCDPLGAQPMNALWYSDEWMNVWNSPNKAAKINLFTVGKRDWIVAPPVFITDTFDEARLRFAIGIWAYALDNPAKLGSDDSVVFVYSGDCGLTWHVIAVFDSSNTPLGSNPGDSLVVDTVLPIQQGFFWLAFWGSEGTVDDPEDNDVMVDNINIEAVIYDAALLQVVQTPADTIVCKDATVTVNAIVQNQGNTQLDSLFWKVSTDFGFVDSGYYVLGLAPGQSIQVMLAAFTMPNNPTVQVTVETRAYPKDNRSFNNVITYTLYLTAPPQTSLILPDTAILNVPVAVGLLTWGTPYDQILWNFGPHATPQAATGAGPIQVRWDTVGWQTVTIAVTYCANADTLDLVDSVYVDWRVPPTGLNAEGTGGRVQLLDIGGGVVRIVARGMALRRIRVLNVEGRIVQDYALRSGVRVRDVDLGALAEGVYVVEVQTVDGVWTRFRVIRR